MKESIICIYGIKDLRTDKIIYIGQTKNLQHRIWDYTCKSHMNRHFVSKYLHENGLNNFEFVIIKQFDEYDKVQLVKEEDKFILEYNSINNGINQIRSAKFLKNKELRDTIAFREYHKQKSREYRTKNPEKYKEQNHNYYLKNKEKHQEYYREYYKKHKTANK